MHNVDALHKVETLICERKTNLLAVSLQIATKEEEIRRKKKGLWHWRTSWPWIEQ